MADIRHARVLLVEDDDTVRDLTRTVLQDSGYDVIEARTGDEALPLLNDPDHVDILLTDVKMPGRVDGLDLAMLARQNFPSMPVLVVSGFAPELHRRLSDLGQPQMFLSKPYTMRRVVEIVNGMAARLS
jgi:CheY-like chemotaxis protein